MPHMTYGIAPSTMHLSILKAVQECDASCEHTTTVLLGSQDIHARSMQIQLLRDCATICATAVCFLARHSVFAKPLANLCAYICELCGKECAKFPDQESQHCSHICFHCAQECRTFAMT